MKWKNNMRTFYLMIKVTLKSNIYQKYENLIFYEYKKRTMDNNIKGNILNL